jgi:hypothetical protein
MKNDRIDHIVLYLIIACIILAIAAIARLFALMKGFDGFSLFIIFLIAVAIQVVIYLSIHSALERLMLPVIGKLLAKIPFFNKMKAKRATSHIEGSIAVIPEPTKSIDDIRKEQQYQKAKEQEETQNIILEYTRKCFALYVSDEDLEVLLKNVQVYINNLDMKQLKPIKVKELTINDLRHFGWNIWNHLRPRNQMDIAYFLKIVFPDDFKDTEVDSIKRHLRDDEKKGVIKIEKEVG